MVFLPSSLAAILGFSNGNGSSQDVAKNLGSESPLVNYYEEESEPCQCLREEWVLQIAMWCASVMTLIISLTLLCASIMVANKDLTVRFRRKAEKKQNFRRLDHVVTASADNEGCAGKN